MAENPLRLHRPTTKTRSRSVKSYLALALKAAGQPVISLSESAFAHSPWLSPAPGLSMRTVAYPDSSIRRRSRIPKPSLRAQVGILHAVATQPADEEDYGHFTGCVIGRCDKSAKLFTAGVGEPVVKDRGVGKVFAGGLVWAMTARLRKITVTRPACFLFIATFVCEWLGQVLDREVSSASARVQPATGQNGRTLAFLQRRCKRIEG
jgi:hypothetical protein